LRSGAPFRSRKSSRVLCSRASRSSSCKPHFACVLFSPLPSLGCSPPFFFFSSFCFTSSLPPRAASRGFNTSARRLRGPFSRRLAPFLFPAGGFSQFSPFFFFPLALFQNACRAFPFSKDPFSTHEIQIFFFDPSLSAIPCFLSLIGCLLIFPPQRRWFAQNMSLFFPIQRN